MTRAFQYCGERDSPVHYATEYKLRILLHPCTNIKTNLVGWFLYSCAEGKGFEPLKAFTPYFVSSEALSTTQPTLLAKTRIAEKFYYFQACKYLL
jgi:hypothetical protein